MGIYSQLETKSFPVQRWWNRKKSKIHPLPWWERVRVRVKNQEISLSYLSPSPSPCTIWCRVHPLPSRQGVKGKFYFLRDHQRWFQEISWITGLYKKPSIYSHHSFVRLNNSVQRFLQTSMSRPDSQYISFMSKPFSRWKMVWIISFLLSPSPSSHLPNALGGLISWPTRAIFQASLN